MAFRRSLAPPRARGSTQSAHSAASNGTMFSSTSYQHAKMEADKYQKAHLKRALSKIEKDSCRYKAEKTLPWEDADGKLIWSTARICVARVVRSQTFETIMGLVIVGNMALIVEETNADASCYPDYAENLSDCPTQSSKMMWAFVCNLLLQFIYTLECFMRAFVERRDYVWNRWNQLDLAVVILGWVGMAITEFVNFNVLRIFRVIRLLRAGRLLIVVPELYILLSGLTASCKAIFFGSILLGSVLFMWSIVAVELMHPVNMAIDYQGTCDRCPEGFASVYSAGLTLFSQIVAGDGWGAMSLPIAESAPWTAPVLFSMVVTTSLGVMNLILAIVVEKAPEARQNDMERRAEQRETEREELMVELAILCDMLDQNNNGALSLDEMLQGYSGNKNFRDLMAQLGIDEGHVETIFNVLDGDQSGEVDYTEFCQHLGNCRKKDPLLTTSVNRYAIEELRQLIHQDVVEVLQEHTKLLHRQLDLLQQGDIAVKRQVSGTGRESEMPSAYGKAASASRPSPPRPEATAGRQNRDSLMSLYSNHSRSGGSLRGSHRGSKRGGRFHVNLPEQLEGLLTSARRLASHSNEELEEEERPEDWTNLEERFRELQQKFERRMRKERDLKDQCERLLDSLRDLFPRYSELVKEDL